MDDEPKKDDNKTIKDRLHDSLEAFKKNEKVDEIYQYAATNTRDTVAYILMVAGLFLMLLGAFWYGTTLIGVIFGLYFSHEIGDIVKNYRFYVEKLGMVHSLILGGTLLGFFIAAPFIFVGAAVAVALRQLLGHHE